MSGIMIRGPEGKGLRRANDRGKGRIELNKKEIKRALVPVKLSVCWNARWMGGVKLCENLGKSSWYALLEAIKITSDNTDCVFAAVWRSKMS